MDYAISYLQIIQRKNLILILKLIFVITSYYSQVIKYLGHNFVLAIIFKWLS